MVCQVSFKGSRLQGVLSSFKWAVRVFETRCVREVSMVFQKCFKEVSRVLQEIF